MASNGFGQAFRFTTWGESHGPAIGCVVDGCPPGIPLAEDDLQVWLDKRRPGQSRFTTQRQEPDSVRILSGVFEGQTTGTPIGLVIENVDQRSRDYSKIADRFRPGHADYTYWRKYGIRDYRGGGRSSARETAMRVAAGGIARKVLGDGVSIRGALVRMGEKTVDRARWDWNAVGNNPFFCPDAAAAEEWADYLDSVRKAGSSVGAVIEIVAEGVPAGLGEPVYGKLDGDLAAAMMSINAVKGVEMGDGFAAAANGARPPMTRWPRTAKATSPSSPTMPAACWAAFPRVSPWLRVLRSSRPARSSFRAGASPRRAKPSRSSPRAATTPVSASAPCRSAKR